MRRMRTNVLLPWATVVLCSCVALITVVIRFRESAFFLPAYLFIIGIVAVPFGIITGVLAALVVPRTAEEGRGQLFIRFLLMGTTSAAAVLSIVLPFIEHPT